MIINEDDAEDTGTAEAHACVLVIIAFASKMVRSVASLVNYFKCINVEGKKLFLLWRYAR